MLTLWLEESPARGYKHLHSVGCRDVRDPEPVEFDGTLAGLEDVADFYAMSPVTLAPCTRGLVS